MTDWQKLLIYELATEHSNGSFRSAKYRLEIFQKEGNVLDETRPINLLAAEINHTFQEFQKKQEEEKEEKNKSVRKRRKERWDKIFDDLTNAPRKAYPKLSLEYQLGHFIGDYIVEKYLPTLSIDGSTHTIIDVTKEEAEEYKRLEEIWWNALHPGGNMAIKAEANKEWNHRMAHRDMLTDKYMPKTLECHVPRISSVEEDKMDELKRGIINALWNSDVSNYSCSNISDIEVVIEEDCFFSVVNLKLAKD